MIKDCYIEIELKKQNYKHYENLGYNIPKCKNKEGRIVLLKGSKIKVHQYDILETARVEIIVTCDCCGKDFKRYKINRKHDVDYCDECIAKDKDIYRKIYFDRKNEKTYDEIKQYVKQYIDNNGTVKGILENIPHRDQYYRKNYNIKKTVEELDIDWFDICYYGNVEWIKTKEYLDETILEISKRMGGIPDRNYLISIGITKIIVFKFYESYEQMYTNLGLFQKYGKDFLYRDKNGNKYKSFYERTLADYFIENKIKFDRESQVFLSLNDGGMSDFTIYELNGGKKEIEIWGYLNRNNNNKHKTKLIKRYELRHKEKMEMYNKLNIDVISLYSDDFFKTKNSLYDFFDSIFKKYNLIKEKSKHNTKYDNTENLKEYIINNLDDIFGELEYIPSVNEFKNFNALWLSKFIYSNFKSFEECAKYIGRKTKRQYLRDIKIHPHNSPLLVPKTTQ